MKSMTRLIGLTLGFGLTVALSGACGSGDESDPAAGGSSSTTTTFTSTPPPTTSSSGTTSSNTINDESTSCDDAIEMEAGKNSQDGTFYDYEGVINPAGDTDFFKVTVASDDSWIRIGTDANSEDDPDLINTVITLFDADGTNQLAQNLYDYPYNGDDSDMVVHIKKAGDYCLKVEDYSTYKEGETPEGGYTFTYRVFWVPIDFDLYAYYNLDKEPNDAVGQAQAITTYSEDVDKYWTSNVAGHFDTGSDVDVYSFKTPIGATMGYVYFPWGGTGSTSTPGMVRLLDANGDTVGELDQEGSARQILVHVDGDATYHLQVNRQKDSSLGEHDFYFLKLRMTDSQNPQEIEPNNDSVTASVAMGKTNSSNPKLFSYYVGGELDGGSNGVWAADEDWWSFEADQGKDINLSCKSVRYGTGLIAPEFAIVDANLMVLQSEKEKSTDNLYWSNTSSSASKKAVKVATSGTHYLRIIASDKNAAVSATNYQCGIHVVTQ